MRWDGTCSTAAPYTEVWVCAGADQGLDATDWTAHLPLCENLKPQFLIRDGGVMVQLDDRDRTGELRSEAMGARAAQLARHMEIRDRVLQVQRDYRLPPGLVADGRDMATRVFTDASLAIYVTAEPEERARRRYLELKARGGSANICTLIEEIKETRQTGPGTPRFPPAQIPPSPHSGHHFPLAGRHVSHRFGLGSRFAWEADPVGLKTQNPAEITT